MIWTIIEPGLGITAASIATLRPLLHGLKIRGFTSDKSSQADPNNNSLESGGTECTQEPNRIRATTKITTTISSSKIPMCNNTAGESRLLPSVHIYSARETRSRESIIGLRQGTSHDKVSQSGHTDGEDGTKTSNGEGTG
jgi:hypothetical protein